MTFPIRVFIFGSCVSRDFLDISSANNFKLVDYYARSSFASIGAKPILDEKLLSKIESKWQRSMVARDLEKNVFNGLSKANYDVILVDLIDERFNLAKIRGSLCTISTEYKKHQDVNSYKKIAFDSEEKFESWRRGFDKFIDMLKSIDAVDKLRVNKVYWADRIDGGEGFSEELSPYAQRNNNMLERMYDYIGSYININQFLNYPRNVLVAARSHKWGVQPFHYVDDFYFYTKKSLEITIPKKDNKPSISNKGKVFPDLLSAYKSIKNGEFFIHVDGVMYPFKWNLSAGIHRPVVFFTPGRTIRGKPVPIFQRAKYFDELEGYNCVSCFDPTLFKDAEMNLAWFQGEKKRFYAIELAKLWRDFVNKVKIHNNKILYYASSGGGIPAFFLAKGTPNATLFMSNVQTDVRDYDPRTLDKLVEVAFGNEMAYVESASPNQNRFSINGHSGPFNLIYAQNVVDLFHYERHYKKWRNETDLSFFNTVKFIEYDDPVSGHGPLDASAEVDIIRGILEGTEYDSVFPQVKVEIIYPEKKRRVEKLSVNIEHSAFPTIKITFPIDWNLDPYQSKNWRHHLNSLRWLRSFGKEEKKSIIMDFYNYHFVNKKSNPYFDTRRGDHTIAIRIDSILHLREGFEKCSEINDLLSIILKNDIASLLKNDVYQENNHGLMADMAIIHALKVGMKLSPDLINKVHGRLLKTLVKMYDQEGVCLEHSVSYQEYNLAILGDIRKNLPMESAAHSLIDKIFAKSREFLGYHLLDNGQYIPIGDSFRHPNLNVLNQAYGFKDSQLALAPFAKSDGVFYAKSGYFIYRNAESGTHISLVSAWHSHVHKQNDELSIFLYHKGHIVFDDPGYTDSKKWSEILSLKSQQWHSNFWIEGFDWSDVRLQPTGSEVKLLNDNPISVIAKQSRHNGFELVRNLEISKRRVLINDTVTGEETHDVFIRHQFLLADVVPLINGNSVSFFSKHKSDCIAKIEVVGTGTWVIEDAERVGEDRRDMTSCNLLVYRSLARELRFIVDLC